MPRLSEEKRNELEAFWRAHIEGWRDSALNQREYCEAHGLPLKRFGNWRAKFRHEDPRPTGKLLWRRGGASEHMFKHMRSDEHPYIPSGRSGDAVRRRNFSAADKRRIVEEACSPGASVSGVAKKYGMRVSDLLCMSDPVHASPKGSMNDYLERNTGRTSAWH